MIWMIGLSLLITPPLLWLYCYNNVIAQPHPTDSCQYLTAEQAKKVLVKRTLASGALRLWSVYAAISVYAIYIMMS